MAFEDGPYVQAACFCDIALRDDTGAFSLIRIVDTVTQSAQGENPPKDMPPVIFSLKLILMLKSGMARGRSAIRIVPELPSGETLEEASVTVHFEGEEKGTVSLVSLNQVFPLEGLYWFNVYIDDTKITSVPLRVKYDRIVSKKNR